MAVRPWGEDFMADAFLALVEYNFKSDSMEIFKKESGFDLDSIGKARGIEAMIDEATGHRATAFAAFADWVATNQWGVEE